MSHSHKSIHMYFMHLLLIYLEDVQPHILKNFSLFLYFNILDSFHLLPQYSP